MTRVTTARLGRRTVGGGLVIAAAMGLMNLTVYGFQIVCSNVLGPSRYSGLATVMAMLLVLSVLALGLQATAARRVAAAPAHAHRIEPAILRLGYGCGLGLGALCLVLAPLIDRVLRLEGLAIPAMIAVTAVPMTIVGAQSGILQGEQRWHALAAVYASTGLGRILFGLAGLAVHGDTLGAVAGVMVGAFVPMGIGAWVLHRHERATVPHGAPANGLWRELAHNSHALVAFFALTNADILIARTVLDNHQSGLYAAGLLMTKAVLFLPQFVVVAAFPAMSRPNASHRVYLLGLSLVAAIGLVTTLGVAMLPGLGVRFVGGADYRQLHDQLWLFALLGTVLALIQMLVYSLVARQRQRMVFVVWAALLVLVCCGGLIATRTELLVVVLVVDTVLLTALLGWLVCSKPEPARH